MKSYFRSFILLLLIIGIMGCTTSLRISVVKPAAIDLKKDVDKILVINNTRLHQKSEDVVEGVLTGEQIRGDSLAAEKFAKGLVRNLSQNSDYEATALKNIAIKGKHESISWQNLQEICDKHKAQALVVLENLDTDAPIGGTVGDHVLGASGSSLEGTAMFSIYHPGTQHLRQQIKVGDVYHVPTSGSNDPLGMLSDMARKREYIADLGYELGLKAGSMLYPNWVWVDREFYGGGSKGLRQAKPMIKAGNWDIAEQKLRPMLEDSKKKVRKKSTFNLALVLEGQGKLDSALHYAEKAALNYNAKPANEYINQLKQRKSEWEVIQLQEEH